MVPAPVGVNFPREHPTGAKKTPALVGGRVVKAGRCLLEHNGVAAFGQIAADELAV